LHRQPEFGHRDGSLFNEPEVVGTIVFPLILIVEPTGQRSDDRA
jgi:hypothetical protein